MRLSIRTLAPLALLCAFAPAAAQAQASSAQAAYVERRGLLELDAQCRLLDPDLRAALSAGAGQARGALLGGGWSLAQFAELETATVEAARTRGCEDPRTAAAVEQARRGFAAWARMSSMDFPGYARSWRAARIPDANGWLMRQDDAQSGARFGVREIAGQARLALTLTFDAARAAPAAAQLAARDPLRARASQIDAPGRLAVGLEAGAPPPRAAQIFFAAERIAGPAAQGRREITFVFPDAAFEAMMMLDAREAVEIRLGAGAETQRLLFEIGDAAAARAFLALQQR